MHTVASQLQQLMTSDRPSLSSLSDHYKRNNTTGPPTRLSVGTSVLHLLLLTCNYDSQ
jgi:hypothetical protein